MDREPSVEAWDQPRSASRLLPFMLVVGACLVAGILLGALAGGKFTPSLPSSSPAAVYILLGYENLKESQKLTAFWVVTFDGSGHVDYLGYSPATILTLDSGQPALLKDYLADPLGAPAHLYRLPRIPQPAIVVEFDSIGLIAIINRSGGLNVDGKSFHGQEILADLDARSDPLDSMREQARIVRALFHSTGPCLSESTLAGLSGEHVISSMPLDRLVQECVAHGPYMDDAIRVSVFDQVVAMVLPDGSTGLLPTN
jgi:hypothetical protein